MRWYLFPDHLRVQKTSHGMYIGNKLTQVWCQYLPLQTSAIPQPGACLFCLIFQFLLYCLSKVFLQGYCKGAGDFGHFASMHSPVHLHMLITGVVLAVSNRMLKYPKSHLLCFGYRTFFKQSLGPGTAAPEKKAAICVIDYGKGHCSTRAGHQAGFTAAGIHLQFSSEVKRFSSFLGKFRTCIPQQFHLPA